MAAPPRPSAKSFENFDDSAVFERFKRLARSHETQNFVIDFNENQALCAFDLSKDDFESALKNRVAERNDANRQKTTRWINIWCPEKQEGVIKLLADHYGLSPRLALSMQCDPIKPEPVADPLSREGNRVKQAWQNRSWQTYHQSQLHTGLKADSDVESHELPSVEARRSLDLNHYRIVNEIWHFISVDWGHKYTSIGFNQLYETKARVEFESAERQHSRPEGRRIWSWILLCTDGTVISINENPFPYHSKLDKREQHELDSIRYNSLNVLTQLSQATDQERPLNPIMTVQVRAGRKSSMAESRVSDDDSPSLLLYYLFDDWYTSYSLVAKSDHEYRRQLDVIRREMFQSATLDHVHKLHSLGHQLSVLKRMYEGYNLIIQRITNRPHMLNAAPMKLGYSGLSERDANGSRSGTLELEKTQAEGYGVPISSAAALRFERLKDNITLYALSEIGACLDEKNSLMSMNFNLIAIKEESYVERLTRITILLAKFTILFIPVSVMASYFGINFSDAQFTVKEFWASFAVLFFLSFLFLIAFGWLSDTSEGGPIYQSLTRTSINAWRGLTGKPPKKKKRT
ncbi:hypothetical protein MMC10_004945 [Thelotrema lepadinum]|nr:hypothetical protein [Thelotrema lepadinum]